MEKHTTVLLNEAVDALAIKRDGVYVDATLGAHGHGGRIVAGLGPKGTYIGIDADATAIRDAETDLKGVCTIKLLTGNFRNIDSLLDAQGLPAGQAGIEAVDGILADLGWRMEQFSGNGKGFSFQVDEPLVMTYGDPETYPFTARDIINEWDEENIISILEGYGEERYAWRIAKAICAERVNAPIRTTFSLKEVIERAVPAQYLHGKIHPSTRTFQALRIAVNDELGALETFLTKCQVLLKPHGRLAIITFHSLEDRIVKHTFRAFAHDQKGVLITKKPILPSREEMNSNKRARSAKLRIFEKV
jgi:16S rRNA (cytosine1402-N4)-methyltransferase